MAFSPLTTKEIEQLESQGCSSSDWSGIKVSDSLDLKSIRNSRLEGSFAIEDNVTIENVSLLQYNPGATYGVGTEVSVLDEAGSRAVKIYPGISAQTALLLCRVPDWKKNHGEEIVTRHISSLPNHSEAVIGKGTIIRNCRDIINVAIGRNCIISGASHLKNGTLINNSSDPEFHSIIGPDVNAENFIIEDAIVDSGTLLRNCYVGQGCRLEKGFTAHDSLFFANCSMENGEACALFAGPFSVSVHKSSLLIGCQTSFMNAGSGTNQSNHMYKMGPIHWGILERGVKTSSYSYLMLGAKIGAFSLLMGQHKTHPDSSEFPFSYLFGDDRGATVVVPGAMLRSCGLMRDEQKWHSRDRRIVDKLPEHDRINFDVLNPLTVDTMLSALDVINQLLTQPADDDRYLRYKGMKFTRAALERARHLYETAIYKYLDLHIAETGFPEKSIGNPESWVDLAGQLVTRSVLNEVLEAGSIDEIEKILDSAYQNYEELQNSWIATRFSDKWHKPKEIISHFAKEFDEMILEDKRKYLDDLAAQTEMLKL